MSETFLGGRVTLRPGNCAEIVEAMPDNSVDSIVTDPPYALVSILKRFGKPGSAPAKDVYGRSAAGFMGKQWDTGETAFDPAFWAECLRVLKPGGHVAAFGGTRTYHRLACAIEDAGFEIRDCIFWCYGVGFPKSHNVSENIGDGRCACTGPQRAASVEQHNLRSVRQSDVSEAEPLTRERREVLHQSVPEQGAHSAVHGAELTEGGPRGQKPCMEGRDNLQAQARELRERQVRAMPSAPKVYGAQGRVRDAASSGDGGVDRSSIIEDGNGASFGSPTPEQHAKQPRTVAGQPQPQAGGAWPLCGGCGKPIIPDGLGTALKPAVEPICLARKPLDGTVAANVLQHGTGAINIDGCRVEAQGRPAREIDPKESANGAVYAGRRVAGGGFDGGSKAVGTTDLGRWPANLIHDGSPEVLAGFPETKSTLPGNIKPSPSTANTYGEYAERSLVGHVDEGSAARFFYTAKADADDRLGFKHPTIKPVDLMQWLVRLVTPKGGICLDPFAGTGTTGEAAWREGMRAVLIEREEEYQDYIRRRMELAEKPTERSAVARTKGKIAEHAGPLFGDVA